MRILILNFSAFFMCFLALNAQEYAVNNIPKEVKEGAYAVVRKDNVSVELLAVNKAKYSRQMAISVLNKSGLDYSVYRIFYDSGTKINKFTAVVYDENGKEIKKLKGKDLIDASVYDGFSLYIDDRIQFYDYTPVSYPFTIEFYEETISSSTISLPGWRPIEAYNIGIEQSNYNFINSSGIEIRKKENGFSGWPVSRAETNGTLSYSIKNVAPVEEEVLSPVLSELTPTVKLSPKQFQLEGVKGSFENWQQFGKWYYDNLLVDKKELSQKDKENVNELLKGVTDPVEKIRKLYQYMQSKTRYVNVSIGIGGWEPFPATYVSEKSYGDCKALSNYMVSLLNYAGIDGFHTIVYANHDRKQDMDEHFASLQGNHMIVNVPLKDETIWLECTSQQTAFNYLGRFTDDRFAVSVGPQGGKIVNTQKFSSEQSREKIMVKGELMADGNLKGNLNMTDLGLQYQDNYRIVFETEKEQKQILNKRYEYLPNFNLKKYDFQNDRDNAVFTTNIEFESTQYATKFDNSLLINVIPAGRSASSFKKDNQRKNAFEIRYGYTDEIEFELKIPAGYKLSEEFKDVIFMSEFGSYLLSVKTNADNSLKIYRKLLVKDGVFPKEKFNDFVEFRRKIASLDNSKILIEKI